MTQRLTPVFFLFCLFSSFYSFSQSGKPLALVSPGSITLNLGAGPGGHYNDDYHEASVGIKSALEFSLWKAGPGSITLGLETGLSVATYTHTFILAGRSAWHCGWGVRGLDTYAGVSLGVGSYANTDDVYHLDGSEENRAMLVAGVFSGASYFVAPHFGFNVEVGYDISIVQIGVIFKLR